LTDWQTKRNFAAAPEFTNMPKLLLHIEGAAALFAACLFYHLLHGSWLWFAGLILTPSCIRRVINARSVLIGNL
jgi:hypothetical protein